MFLLLLGQTTLTIVNEMELKFFQNIDAMCDEQLDVILVCSSILSTETVLRSIPIHNIKPDISFADVLSVKEYPMNLFLEILPPEFGIVRTHPMFGPESGKTVGRLCPLFMIKLELPRKLPKKGNVKSF